MGIGQRLKARTLGLGKPALGSDQNGPFVARHSAQDLRRTDKAFVAKHDLPRLVPIRQQTVELLQLRHLRHIGTATLLGGLKGMGLQPVLTDTLRVGKFGVHRHNTPCAHLGGLLDNEIRTGLFDRRKHQPQVGRHQQVTRFATTHQFAILFIRLGHFGHKFTVHAIKQGHKGPVVLTHHPEKIMGLLLCQRNGLPFGQGLIYIEAYFCFIHETYI